MRREGVPEAREGRSGYGRAKDALNTKDPDTKDLEGTLLHLLSVGVR